MRQGTLIALVGGVAFVVAGLATLPASLVVSRLPPNLALEGVAGSVWRGSAERVAYNGAPIGRLRWSAHPLSLLAGRLDYTVEVERPDGHVRGRVGATLGGAVTAEGVEIRLPVTALNPRAAANAWQGDLEGTVRSARIEAGWPVALAGSFVLSRVRPPGSAIEVGSFAFDFDETATTADTLVGRVRDVEAPLAVRAQLAVRRERSYVLEGEVAPKPGAPPAIANAVAFLGPPDNRGRRSFSITGTF